MTNLILKPGIFKHITCRNNLYPKTNINRFKVEDGFVFWTVEFADYLPVNYTAPHIKGQIWADKQIGQIDFEPHWNNIDGNVNRISFNGVYVIKDGYPLNPIGRTGLSGRGLLGRWGPNHAADPIVTRWKRDNEGKEIVNQDTNKKVLQMVAIQRHDNKMWAIPGGMVDPGEKLSATLKREFMEEALDSFENKQMIDDFFSNGIEIYKGYVDDFRNTDNAWIETVAYNFHDENGDKVGKLQLCAGDDAANVKWMDICKNIQLHANHSTFVEEVVKRLNGHW